MADLVQVQSAVDREDEAARLAGLLVDRRLAACVQIVGPVHSHYRWQGELETASEWLLLAKTTVDRSAAVIELLTAEHPYDNPEVIAVAVVGGSAAYLDWVAAETT
ncbi:MAG TPA: divalent-cation tolerance protein CutA [Acidimicrobiales bacterium]|nr:divalent-cation tolerance protein CutA [Acidimicrobiales bacterium]